jgi:hypothetical protein
MATDSENYDRDLNANALLMLSFYENSGLSPEEKAAYHSMLSFEEASSASVFLMHVAMSMYADETGRTKEELSSHIRKFLLELSNLNG